MMTHVHVAGTEAFVLDDGSGGDPDHELPPLDFGLEQAYHKAAGELEKARRTDPDADDQSALIGSDDGGAWAGEVPSSSLFDRGMSELTKQMQVRRVRRGRGSGQMGQAKPWNCHKTALCREKRV